MVKWVGFALLVLALVSGHTAFVFAGSPRMALPALADAEATQAIQCPGDTLIIRAGFDPKEDGRYALVYFGPVANQDGKIIPAYPHVWLRFDKDNEIVAVLLVVAKDKMDEITIEQLKALYPSVCALAGTSV